MHPQLALGYAEGILHVLVYLREVLGRQLQYLWDSSAPCLDFFKCETIFFYSHSKYDD